MKDLTWKKILTVVKAMIHCDIDEKKSGRKRNNFTVIQVINKWKDTRKLKVEKLQSYCDSTSTSTSSRREVC